MDQVSLGQRGPAAEILRMLQRQGPKNVKALETELGVSTNAVREQLQQLQNAGLVQVSKVRRGAGRPAHVYSLSEKAQALFPQPYDVVLKLLIEEIVSADGVASAQRMLNSVGQRMAEGLSDEDGSLSLRERIEVTAAALGARGMPITVSENGDSLTLHSWACPYHQLARSHQGICEMEQHMLERALGASVTITERMPDGFAGCKFVIEQQ